MIINSFNSYSFSEALNLFINFIEKLRDLDRSYLIYGAGRAGVIIARHMPERVLGFVDQSPSLIGSKIDRFDVFAPKDLYKLEYDQLIISVLGREKEIAQCLFSDFQVPKERIIWFNRKTIPASFLIDLDHVLMQLAPLNDQRIFVQIGASNGNLAQRFASNGWQVYAFDANPLYSDHYKLHEGTPSLKFFNQAICLEDLEFVTFYVSESTPGISSLKAFCDSHKPMTVPATSLKRFYEAHDITAIDFFMIDAETMDLAILKTHDWQVPIKAIVAECNKGNIDEMNRYLLGQCPRYKAVVLVWEKPVAAYGVMGKYIGKYTIEKFKTLSGNCFGDALFYDSEKILL